MMKLLCKGSFFALFVLFLSLPAQAQTITIDSPLTFGRFALVDNAAPRILEFRPNCLPQGDPEYLLIVDPVCATVTATGYLPNNRLTITFSTATLTGPGSENFVLDDLRTRPTNVRTDALGEVTFQVRGRITSTGLGGAYLDGTYSGNFTITVTN